MTRPRLLGDPSELAALYLAGALPLEELCHIENALDDGWPELEKELALLQGAAELLALAVPSEPPPARVREFLLERLSPEPTSARPAESVHRAADAVWRNTLVPGMTCRVLSVGSERMSVLLRLEPGACIPAHPHTDTEEGLMIEGELVLADGTILHPGDYFRCEAGSRHQPQHSPEGCIVWLSTAAEAIPLT
jgi:anti-sigma factor ChrR (cupin superfamily)